MDGKDKLESASRFSGSSSRQNPVSSTADYVDDALCAECHADLYDSYQEVGMAKSYYPATTDNLIEDFENNHYFHALSDQHFEMLVRDGQIFQRRYQLDANGQRINELEVRVDAIIGSGNHIRSYLFRTASGEMFQMPLAWYSKTRQWRMNPGYDLPDHMGYQRKITRECMFCHNAYPVTAPAGSDEYWQPHVFPEKLPHGIGCQRCHGPGRKHVELARAGNTNNQAMSQSMVNPANLEADLRDDVCNQCHLQPSSQILSEMVRIGRSDYSFRPGQRLADYRALLDYNDSGSSEERFEINHHPYRMRQSRCFIESSGQMNCLTCHDPHRAVEEPNRLAHYRQQCLKCHQVEQCLPALEIEQPTPRAGGISKPAGELSDCARCHMPERRTQDVIHATMTDHKIVTRPASAEQRLAERNEPPPASRNLNPFPYLDYDRQADRTEAMAIYEAIAGSQAGNDGQLKRLVGNIQQNQITGVQPLAELASAYRDRGAAGPEIDTLSLIVRHHPEHVQANLELAMALAAVGDGEQALRYYLRALELGPPLPETHVGLGMSMLQRGDVAAAESHFREAVRLRPLYPEALLNLGIVLHAQQKWTEARQMLLRARAADPSFVEADFYLRSIPGAG